MPKLKPAEKRADLVDQGRLLQTNDVLKMWPVSRSWLERRMRDPVESERIPSYLIGGKRCYRYDELMYWLEGHKEFIDNASEEADDE